MSRTAKLFTALLLAATLSACSDPRTQRIFAGSAVGAGLGALGSAVSGGNTVNGALIGGHHAGKYQSQY